jgi:hypothetical protein
MSLSSSCCDMLVASLSSPCARHNRFFLPPTFLATVRKYRDLPQRRMRNGVWLRNSGYRVQVRISSRGIVSKFESVRGISSRGIVSKFESVRGISSRGIVSKFESVRGISSWGIVSKFESVRGITVLAQRSFVEGSSWERQTPDPWNPRLTAETRHKNILRFFFSGHQRFLRPKKTRAYAMTRFVRHLYGFARFRC